MSLSTQRSHTFLDDLGTHAHALPAGVRYDRAKRYESDRVLRDAAARRLDEARERLDDAIRRCLEQETLGGVAGLERVRAHLVRVAGRLCASDWDADLVPPSWAFHPRETEALFSLDQVIHKQVNHLVDLFETRAVDHDFLAHVREDLWAIERKIDDRVFAKQGIFHKFPIDL